MSEDDDRSDAERYSPTPKVPKPISPQRHAAKNPYAAPTPYSQPRPTSFIAIDPTAEVELDLESMESVGEDDDDENDVDADDHDDGQVLDEEVVSVNNEVNGD